MGITRIETILQNICMYLSLYNTSMRTICNFPCGLIKFIVLYCKIDITRIGTRLQHGQTLEIQEHEHPWNVEMTESLHNNQAGLVYGCEINLQQLLQDTQYP